MSFFDRIVNSEIATSNLQMFLGPSAEVHGFGIESIGNQMDGLRQYLMLLTNNYNDATSMLLEYMPDYIVYANDKVFFLEAKVSLTPCWSRTRINDANQKVGERIINASNCGEIAREALLAYRKFFPDTVILYVNNYNRNAVLAQYAKDIQCLRCEKTSSEKYDCNLCPLETGEFFDSVERNNTAGSGTPSTNINLDSFRPADEFFETEFGIEINPIELKDMENSVRDKMLRFSNRVDVSHKREIIKEIWNSGQRNIRCPYCSGKFREIDGPHGRFLGCNNFRNHEDGTERFTVSL